MFPSFGFGFAGGGFAGGFGEGTPTAPFGFGFGRDDSGAGVPSFGAGTDTHPSTSEPELPHFGDEEPLAVNFPSRKRLNTDSPPVLGLDLRNVGVNDGQGSESAFDSAPATARLERGDDELSFAGAERQGSSLPERPSSSVPEKANGVEVVQVELPVTDYGKLQLLSELVDELQARHDAVVSELHLEKSLRQQLQDEVISSRLSQPQEF
jgi:hypothetical protein